MEKVKGATAEAKELNKYLEEVVISLHQHYRELVQQNRVVTAETLKKAFLGVTDAEKTVLNVFNEHLEHIKNVLENYKRLRVVSSVIVKT